MKRQIDFRWVETYTDILTREMETDEYTDNGGKQETQKEIISSQGYFVAEQCR